MKYSFEKVVNGICSYIDCNIYTGMNDLQEIVARMVVGRIVQDSDEIKSKLIGNGFIRTFGVIDADGMVDVDRLAEELREQISRKGKLEISLPMFGKLKFVSNDIDDIHRFIREA